VRVFRSVLWTAKYVIYVYHVIHIRIITKCTKHISIQADMTAEHKLSSQEASFTSKACCGLLQKDVRLKLEKLIILIAIVFISASVKLGC